MNRFIDFLDELKTSDNSTLIESVKQGYGVLFESKLTDISANAKKIVDALIDRPEDKILKDFPQKFNSNEVHITFQLEDDLQLVLMDYVYDTHKSINAKLTNPSENDWGDFYEIEVNIPKSKIPIFLEIGMDFIKKDLYPWILHEVVHYLQTKNDPVRLFDTRIGRGGPKNFPAVKDPKKYNRGEYQLDDDETIFSRYMNSWHEIQSYVIQLAADINIKFPEYSKFDKLKEANKTDLYKRFQKYIPSKYLPRINKMILANLTDKPDSEKLNESITSSKNITLYRGLENEFNPKYDLAKSDAPNGYSTWTDNPILARQYAGTHGYVYSISLPISEMGDEYLNEEGDRVLFFNNQKPAGLSGISGNEYLVYNDHELFNSNDVKLFNSPLIESISTKSMSLNDIYGSKWNVDDSEVIHNFVELEDEWDIQFLIKDYSVNELKQLQTAFGEDTVFDAYKNASKAQKKIVSHYRNNDKERNSQPIVVANKTLLDGYHRVIAAIIDGSSIKGIDVYGEEAIPLTESLDGHVKYHIDHIDSIKGQQEWQAIASINNNPIGIVDFSTYNDDVAIKMIEVDDNYKRKGIAKQLIQLIQSEYPTTEIDFGMLTDDGLKLVDSLKSSGILYIDENKVKRISNLSDLYKKLYQMKTKLMKKETYTDDESDLFDKISDLAYDGEREAISLGRYDLASKFSEL